MNDIDYADRLAEGFDMLNGCGMDEPRDRGDDVVAFPGQTYFIV